MRTFCLISLAALSLAASGQNCTPVTINQCGAESQKYDGQWVAAGLGSIRAFSISGGVIDSLTVSYLGEEFTSSIITASLSCERRQDEPVRFGILASFAHDGNVWSTDEHWSDLDANEISLYYHLDGERLVDDPGHYQKFDRVNE